MKNYSNRLQPILRGHKIMYCFTLYHVWSRYKISSRLKVKGWVLVKERAEKVTA